MPNTVALTFRTTQPAGISIGVYAVVFYLQIVYNYLYD